MSKLFRFSFLALFLFCGSNAFSQVDLSNGLIAWYPFSGNANDSSGNGHNGIIKDAKLTKDRFGNDNSAYYCDGANKAITILALGDYGAQGITISIWVKTSSTTATVELAKGAIGSMYINAITPGTFLADFCGTIKHDHKNSVSDSIVTNGNWVNLTASSDGKTTKLYVNGVLQKSFHDRFVTGGSDFIIGNKNFVGSIDDVRIYNRAISADEVLAIYNLTH